MKIDCTKEKPLTRSEVGCFSDDQAAFFQD